jgi:hypothetical protein
MIYHNYLYMYTYINFRNNQDTIHSTHSLLYFTQIIYKQTELGERKIHSILIHPLKFILITLQGFNLKFTIQIPLEDEIHFFLN